MEKVLAKPPCSGLSHVCLRCVDLWGNVVFKIHNRALWVFFFCLLQKLTDHGGRW